MFVLKSKQAALTSLSSVQTGLVCATLALTAVSCKPAPLASNHGEPKPKIVEPAGITTSATIDRLRGWFDLTACNNTTEKQAVCVYSPGFVIKAMDNDTPYTFSFGWDKVKAPEIGDWVVLNPGNSVSFHIGIPDKFPTNATRISLDQDSGEPEVPSWITNAERTGDGEHVTVKYPLTFRVD